MFSKLEYPAAKLTTSLGSSCLEFPLLLDIRPDKGLQTGASFHYRQVTGLQRRARIIPRDPETPATDWQSLSTCAASVASGVRTMADAAALLSPPKLNVQISTSFPPTPLLVPPPQAETIRVSTTNARTRLPDFTNPPLSLPILIHIPSKRSGVEPTKHELIRSP